MPPVAVAFAGRFWHTQPLPARHRPTHGCGCSSVVEHDLAKVGVEGSSPFARSNFSQTHPAKPDGYVVFHAAGGCIGSRMTILVTGSAGHLGEGRSPHAPGTQFARAWDRPEAIALHRCRRLDRRSRFVRRQMEGVTAVIHTATLHKPHVATHSKQDFVDTNVTGTLNLLEAAVAAGVRSFVFTSTTSAFGSQLRPRRDRPRCGSPRICRRCRRTSTARRS